MAEQVDIATDFKGKSMHVLYTGLIQAKVLSGGDQLFLDIAPRLPKDISITVITPHFAKEHWDKIDKSNIKFKYLKPNRFDFKDRPILIFMGYIVRAWQTYKILKKEKIQTIYSCSDIAYADVWPAYLITRSRPDVKWLSRIYHVLLPPQKRHGSYLVNVIAYRLQRVSFWMMRKHSTTIFALNKKLYDEVLDLGMPKSKLAILEAGIDFNYIHNFKPAKKYPYSLVLFGRLAPVKGIYDAVKIWKKVHDQKPELKLAWIGHGAEQYRSKMEELLKANSITDSFTMTGFVDKEEAFGILQSANIFLCTDHEIGWGLAVCEAMASGLPVVSYEQDVFGSVYKQGYSSVELFNTDKFADEVLRLLDKPKERSKMAKEAVVQASEFDHQKIINELLPYLK